MFLRERWYVACWSRELLDKPLAVTMLGEDIVIFRTEDGIAALEDRCPHRQLPLHLGRVAGSLIRCGYHGAEFDASGRCVRVPSQKLVPSAAKVRAYPATERHGLAWVWTGSPDDADPATIPNFSRLTDARYSAVGTTNSVDASYQLVIDNLLDLSHVGFVHGSTIGNAEMGEKGEIGVKKTGDGVTVTRWVRGVSPPPATVKLGIFAAGVNIDRSQVIEYHPPSNLVIHVGNSEAAGPASEPRWPPAVNFWIVNAVTPVTDTRCAYFWAAVRDYAVGDAKVDDIVFAQVAEAFDEDKTILQAQQRAIERHGDRFDVAFKADAGVIEGRRLLARAITAEGAPGRMID